MNKDVPIVLDFSSKVNPSKGVRKSPSRRSHISTTLHHIGIKQLYVQNQKGQEGQKIPLAAGGPRRRTPSICTPSII